MAHTETLSAAETNSTPPVGVPPDDPIFPEDAFGTSLMARAQRGSLLQRQLTADATRFTAELATSSLSRDQAHNALHQKRLDLQARERATQRDADLRATFDPAQFAARVESIHDLTDPVAQLGAIGVLRSRYARYRTMPELSRLMEDQLATLEPAIAARQEARLHERISANRYALTPKEAAEKFPGYRITPTPLPGSTTGGGPSRLIYLAEDDVDPRLEAEAFHLLHTASAWGDPVKLEALDRDPAVAAVLRIPGSNFADAYIAAVTEARASQPFASATDGLPPATAFPNDASQNFSAQNSVPLGESIASLASESGTEATAPTTPDGTADSSAATTAPETAPSPASVTLEEQLAALKSVDENWRQQRPVEARSSLGGSPYVDRIRAIETGIEIRDHLLAFIEINRLQLLRDAALESDDGPTIRKLNREIGDLGRKVFGQSISGIDANGHPIAGVEEIFFAGTFGGGIGRAGKLGERALEKYGGRPQAFFRTEWGARYIDRLAKEIARESKVGYTVLSERILIQIAKDVELLREAEVKGVVWHFFRSPVTGEGPSQPLKDALKAAGIKWMFGVRK